MFLTDGQRFTSQRWYLFAPIWSQIFSQWFFRGVGWIKVEERLGFLLTNDQRDVTSSSRTIPWLSTFMTRRQSSNLAPGDLWPSIIVMKLHLRRGSQSHPMSWLWNTTFVPPGTSVSTPPLNPNLQEADFKLCHRNCCIVEGYYISGVFTTFGWGA